MPRDTKRPTRNSTPPNPWRAFLQELDESLTETHELHCIGGFVITQHYGIGRETSDIDFIATIPRISSDDIGKIAGLQSPMHRKYRLYMQHVGITTAPADYTTRLIRMFPTMPWKHLRLFALEAHDLALTKIERNSERDREDVLRLANAGYLQPDVLKRRYQEELQPYLLSKIAWHDKTLELWTQMCWPAH
jgi:hypothetical protein